MDIVNKLLIAFAIVVLSSTSARADWYNVQFSNDPNGSQATQYSGPGIDPSSGNYWNLITSPKSSGTSLYNSNAVLSSNSIAFSSSANVIVAAADNGFTSGTYAPLFSGYMYTIGTDTFSFAGLDTNKAYSLYIYTQAESTTSGESLMIQATNGTTGAHISAVPTTGSDGSLNHFVLNQNYLTITNAHPNASGVLTFSYSPGDVDGYNQANINGIQLSSAVPEPLTLVLLSIGSFLFIAFKLKSVGLESAFSA